MSRTGFRRTRGPDRRRSTRDREHCRAQAATQRRSKATGTTGTKAGATGAKAGTTGTKRTTRTAAAQKGSETELVQLLTPEGERVETAGNSAYAEYAAFVADITPDELRGLYRDMVLTRRFDAEATALQRQGELGLWASLLGQEVAQIGSGRATREGRLRLPDLPRARRRLVRGVDPTNLLGMFRGVNNGGWDSNSNNFHLYTIVIGSQALHATGYAMGITKDGADSAVIAYFGDGASSQGDVSEAFNFAAVYNAPVVFFCQNNQWAISESNEKQTRVPLYQRAQGFGFPGVRVDGNDALACLAVTRWALERARRGEGPALIEAYTYRMGAHTTSDDPSRYRHDDERAAWEAKDPILRLRRFLESANHADEGFFAELEAESETLGKRVREVVRAMPDPGPVRHLRERVRGRARARRRGASPVRRLPGVVRRGRGGLTWRRKRWHWPRRSTNRCAARWTPTPRS
ncbi:thiamine pyrophosphate-dependent dehydrogenase E1 component subunit alpha [Streptomyces thinghirensis]|nr:thiamine pyrophosphate-dependent dehydrogenase E1 component subunit alpha [Streptomyces thinghirensis]